MRRGMAGKMVLALMLAVLAAGGALFFFLGGMGKQPWRVGFMAQLTGTQAELGVQERNAVQMAVEEINAAGGVDGRPIDLLVRDDLGTPDGAKAAVRELMAQGVVAVIGPATSGQAMAALEVSNPAGLVLLSPTVSTQDLSGRDDFFFRVVASHRDRTDAFAERIFAHRGVKRIAVLYDTDNAAYAQSLYKTFGEKFGALGGTVVGETAFSSRTQPDFASLLARLGEKNPDGLLIIANDSDTALIAQQVRRAGWNMPLLASAWAQTETLLRNGGQAVEGMEIEIVYPQDSTAERFIGFRERYQARFGRVPSFGASLAYEAAGVLSAALGKSGAKGEGLKAALLGVKDFQGLIDVFSFDPYGDVKRPFYLSVIRGGKFVTDAGYSTTTP